MLWSDDVISFAREKGFYRDEDDFNFSFSDVYCPMSSSSARLGEARVWSFFRNVVDDMD